MDATLGLIYEHQPTTRQSASHGMLGAETRSARKMYPQHIVGAIAIQWNI